MRYIFINVFKYFIKMDLLLNNIDFVKVIVNILVLSFYYSYVKFLIFFLFFFNFGICNYSNVYGNFLSRIELIIIIIV